MYHSMSRLDAQPRMDKPPPRNRWAGGVGAPCGNAIGPIFANGIDKIRRPTVADGDDDDVTIGMMTVFFNFSLFGKTRRTLMSLARARTWGGGPCPLRRRCLLLRREERAVSVLIVCRRRHDREGPGVARWHADARDRCAATNRAVVAHLLGRLQAVLVIAPGLFKCLADLALGAREGVNLARRLQLCKDVNTYGVGLRLQRLDAFLIRIAHIVHAGGDLKSVNG